MAKVELTLAKLAEIKQKAAGCDPKYWIMDQHGDVVAVDFDNESTKLKIASVDFLEDAEHIAAADPATVLALVEEIERLRAGLKAACPHWQQDGDGINEWRRCCTNSSYTIPEGGEPSEFCPDCGGKVEVLDYDPNIESEAGQ